MLEVLSQHRWIARALVVHSMALGSLGAHGAATLKNTKDKPATAILKPAFLASKESKPLALGVQLKPSPKADIRPSAKPNLINPAILKSSQSVNSQQPATPKKSHKNKNKNKQKDSKHTKSLHSSRSSKKSGETRWDYLKKFAKGALKGVALGLGAYGLWRLSRSGFQGIPGNASQLPPESARLLMPHPSLHSQLPPLAKQPIPETHGGWMFPTAALGTLAGLGALAWYKNRKILQPQTAENANAEGVHNVNESVVSETENKKFLEWISLKKDNLGNIINDNDIDIPWGTNEYSVKLVVNPVMENNLKDVVSEVLKPYSGVSTETLVFKKSDI